MQNLASAQQLLTWLTPKLNGQEALINQLLTIQTQLSDTAPILEELNDPVQELIRKRLGELLEMPDREFSLAFEQFRLERDLEDVFEDLASHVPDTGTVYEGSEVDKLIRQAPNGKGGAEGAKGKSGSSGQKQNDGAHTGLSGKGGHQKEEHSQNHKPAMAGAVRSGGAGGAQPHLWLLIL